MSQGGWQTDAAVALEAAARHIATIKAGLQQCQRVPWHTFGVIREVLHSLELSIPKLEEGDHVQLQSRTRWGLPLERWRLPQRYPQSGLRDWPSCLPLPSTCRAAMVELAADLVASNTSLSSILRSTERAVSYSLVPPDEAFLEAAYLLEYTAAQLLPLVNRGAGCYQQRGHRLRLQSAVLLLRDS